MKPPAKKAAHAHQQHKPHKPQRPHKKAPAKKIATKKHPAHAKHPGSPAATKAKQGRAKAAPGLVIGHEYTPDDIDLRDHVYPTRDVCPAFVDLPGMPPVWHQGAAGSCVRYAALALYAYAGGLSWPDLYDEMQVREAVKACAEACGAEYLAVTDLQGCLSDGFPVTFGITLTESFTHDAALLSGVVTPAPGDEVVGPHCLVAVGIGYGAEWADQFPDADPGVRYVKARNSWGDDVHQDGHLLVPIDYVVRHGADFWMMRSAT